MNFSSYLEEIRIQSPDTGIISEQTIHRPCVKQSLVRKGKAWGLSPHIPNVCFLGPMPPIPETWGKIDFISKSIILFKKLIYINDETLGDSNPHLPRIEREKLVAQTVARVAMEARNAALVEASWC